MKITEMKQVIEIEEVEVGECFRMNGEIYLRVACEYDNASVCLRTGDLTHDNLEGEQLVEVVNAEVRIGG